MRSSPADFCSFAQPETTKAPPPRLDHKITTPASLPPAITNHLTRIDIMHTNRSDLSARKCGELL
jgi:hypothetical protein